MPIDKGSQELIAEANARIETIPPEEAIGLLGDERVQLVDLRDIRERQRDGFIPSSYHAPRGMLEFWVDPESPYHKKIFDQPKKFVFYCASGWRSALATRTVQEMGLAPVAHVGGGFSGWEDAGGETMKTEDGREPRRA
ncbi:MAG: rhodanese-like domain-containing protein [Deltaproteobacteria bacterium]|nr:rhodanese-like domain-containing protein [Deltaproteobacteria bacterium]MBW2396171.1 rhodanese-like domain-containing protein [Deltaproteobacteria bacterium]